MMEAQTKGKRQIPAVEGLFTMPPDEPRLIVTKCKSCGSYAFPKRPLCPNTVCMEEEVEEVLLNRRGVLISYVTHHYAPPPPYVAPEPFVPYGIVEVKFPEGLEVIGQLTGCDIKDLRMGMEMELVVDKLFEDDEGNEVMGWKFRPV